MISSNTLSIGNYVIFNGHTVKVKGLQTDELLVEFSDGTLLPVTYITVRPVDTLSHVLVSAGLKLQSSEEILSHTKEVYSIDILGKKYLITGLLLKDSTIWKFDNFISFHYFHQLQNICRLVNENFELVL